MIVNMNIFIVIMMIGVMANVCPIAMTERLPVEMRTNALQMMGAYSIL